MKKNIKKVLALMLVLCASISGCGTKKQTTQEKTTSQKTAAKEVMTITSSKKQETRKLKKSNWIIELDPGHGGNDSGAVGETNDQPQEKDINLKIAKYIKQELSKNSNIKVYLTRTGDTKPELGERVPKAVQDKADLFVSLHNNAKGEIVDYDHGCTVLVPTGNYNKEVSQQAQLLGCYFLKYLEQTGVENQGLLMRTSEKNEKYPNGKIRDYYRVIHNSIEKGIPGVIVEHSFVDNDNDVKQFLKDDSKIKKLAQADAKAIRDYCLGTVKAEKEEKQKVTLIRDSKGKNNKFGDLELYKKSSFAEKHHTGILMIPGKKYPLKIFAVLVVRSTDSYIFDPSQYKNNRQQFLNYVKMKANWMQNDKIEILNSQSGNYSVLALGTCSTDQVDDRTVVLAMYKK